MSRYTFKEKITLKVLEHLNSSVWNLENALRKWYMNPRRDGGLRLTGVGDIEFREAGFEYHDFFLSQKTKRSYNSFVLDLDRRIQCPFFIDVKKNDNKEIKPYIRLYDSRIYMMLSLYGDIDSYLNSIKVRK
jgi:hypothetical protein